MGVAMSLEEWVKTLRPATAVTNVQPNIHAARRHNVIFVTDVTGVTTSNIVEANATDETLQNFAALHINTTETLGCTPVTPVTAEDVNERSRVQQFVDWGLKRAEAEVLYAKLLNKVKDMHSCVECANLIIASGWHCKDWKRSGISYCATETEIGRDVLCMIQRCDGFKPQTTSH